MTESQSNGSKENPIYTELLSEGEREVYLKMSKDQIQEYKEIFDIFDAGGEGTIDNAEIGQVLQGLGETPTQERVQEMINEIDFDGDGEVDFDEFVCLMVKTLYQADKAQEELVLVF